MSKRATAAGLLLVCVAAISGCSGPEGLETGGSRLCDALDTTIPGIDQVVWDNGLTRQEASWATLLDAGVLHGDEISLKAAAEAVGSDTEGFERVLDAAPESLRADLELLRNLLVNPAEIEQRRADPAVVESVEAVRDATPPDVCGWVR